MEANKQHFQLFFKIRDGYYGDIWHMCPDSPTQNLSLVNNNFLDLLPSYCCSVVYKFERNITVNTQKCCDLGTFHFFWVTDFPFN